MSIRFLRTLMLTLPLLATSACQGENDPVRAKTIEISEVSREIQKHPERADSILKEAGLTKETYTQAIFKIANDPEQNALYLKILSGKKP